MSVDRVAMRDGPVWRAAGGIYRLLVDVRHRNFDLAIDFHGLRETNLLTWLSGAKQRLGVKRFDQSFLKFCFNLPPVAEDKNIHVSEMFMRMIGRFGVNSRPMGPALVIPDPARQWATAVLPQEPIV